MGSQAIILAAGKGTRMCSDTAKVLHPISGRPMLGWQLRRLKQSGVDRVHVVVGHKASSVRTFIGDSSWVRTIEQPQPLGTGHATRLGLEGLDKSQPVVVLAGDIPFISANLVAKICAEAAQGHLVLVTTHLANPTGYGRVVRSAKGTSVEAIVEEADANAEEKAITEVYCGIVAAMPDMLAQWVAQLTNDNAQQEYYLPQVVPAARADKVRVVSVVADSSLEVEGVNSMAQLVALERAYSCAEAERLLTQGVYIADPNRIDIWGELTCGRDVRVEPSVVIKGSVTLEDGVEVATGCVLQDCHIGAGTRIEAYSHIVQATIGPQCMIGPFARLRAGTHLHQEAKVGNFVEIKNSTIGVGSKANHLSYVGDTILGKEVNIGAGTITCNYDGTHKHPTTIGDKVFVGSNSSLVAPLTIGAEALISAGSTITMDVQPGSLAFGRARQHNTKKHKKT